MLSRAPNSEMILASERTCCQHARVACGPATRTVGLHAKHNVGRLRAKSMQARSFTPSVRCTAEKTAEVKKSSAPKTGPTLVSRAATIYSSESCAYPLLKRSGLSVPVHPIKAAWQEGIT